LWFIWAKKSLLGRSLQCEQDRMGCGRIRYRRYMFYYTA
jgi:hypothetical protein